MLNTSNLNVGYSCKKYYSNLNVGYSCEKYYSNLNVGYSCEKYFSLPSSDDDVQDSDWQSRGEAVGVPIIQV